LHSEQNPDVFHQYPSFISLSSPEVIDPAMRIIFLPTASFGPQNNDVASEGLLHRPSAHFSVHLLLEALVFILVLVLLSIAILPNKVAYSSPPTTLIPLKLTFENFTHHHESTCHRLLVK
jgi:hypothetical protein